MNKVILMGRLTKAPEIKYLQDDNKTAMARYTLAVDRRYGKDREREAGFISCVTFGKNAEFTLGYSVCRHTYCSNMAKAGMNPKALQYLMGHSDIGVTLNVYTHLGLIDAKEEMNRIAKLA